MDMRVSRKEPRWQPSGLAEVLVSNIFDIYPVYDTIDPNLIVDMEMLDDDRMELLDRAMFSAVKQRGSDPTEILDGIQWSEAILKEVSTSAVQNQVQAAVQQEGTGVQVSFGTVKDTAGKEYFQFAIKLTNAV